MKELITQAQLLKRYHFSRSKVYALRQRDPDFPRPLKTGSSNQKLCWYLDEVEQYMQSKQI